MKNHLEEFLMDRIYGRIVKVSLKESRKEISKGKWIPPSILPEIPPRIASKIASKISSHTAPMIHSPQGRTSAEIVRGSSENSMKNLSCFFMEGEKISLKEPDRNQ